MKKIAILSVLVFFISSFTVSKGIDAMIANEIKAVFKLENFTKEAITVSEAMNDKLPVKITAKNLFKINSEEQLIGYYYFGKAFGKVDYFDYIVIFDKNLIVSKIKILVYREDHGAEIKSKRWLKQFSGKSVDDTLQYQKDIAAISGATISAKSMTHSVNKVLKTIRILHKEEQL